MQHDLLSGARRLAEQADPSVRAAALLRIARAESASDIFHAQQTMLEALQQIRLLSDPNREYLLEEAREVAAAIAPELSPEIPIGELGRHDGFAANRIVQIMLRYGHLDTAFGYLLHYDDSASFPFQSVASVVEQLDPNNAENADRCLLILRRAASVWRMRTPPTINHSRQEFVRVFGQFWNMLSADEALTIAHAIVEEALSEPDTRISASYANEIHFSSQRQHQLFEILHVLRVLDPALAQSLIESHDQLAIAVHRFPDGLATIYEELAAEIERRKAASAGSGGGYGLAGDPADFDRQRALIDATHSGDFRLSISHALEKYLEDSSPLTRNYAPKEYWPSTAAFRSMFYQAGKRLGPEAAKLLDQIPEPDLRLFAIIELAAALAGVPESSITQRRHPNPPEALIGSMANLGSSTSVCDGAACGPTMRSPDGRLIRCPRCLFLPPTHLRWNCNCGDVWNTFQTAGRCPACHFQWEETQCPRCGDISPLQAWYVIGSASSQDCT